MDVVTVSMLSTLPDDVRVRGWTLLRRATKVCIPDSGSPRYTAVYVQPFEPRIDPTCFTGGTVRNGYIRISTDGLKIASWEVARRYAIGCMRAVDARRKTQE